MAATVTLHPLAVKLLEGFMSFDSVEGIWELHVPFPPVVTVEWDRKDPEIMDALLEVHDVIEEQEGLTYNNVAIGDDGVSIVGLAWE